MSPPNAQHRRAYAAIMAYHSNRASSLSGHRENNDAVNTTNTSMTTSAEDGETIRTNGTSIRTFESASPAVQTPISPRQSTTTTATVGTSSFRTSSSVSIRSDGGQYPVLRNLVSIANRGRTNNHALQNSNHPNNIRHTTSSSSSSSTTTSSSTTSSRRTSTTHNGPPAIHPQFRSKAVCKLTCSACTAVVCSRGMKAILLADTRVELYSTDTPPIGVQLVNDDYMTRNCRCRIRDVACLGCGSVVGYHVTTPCNTCLDACNNGHFWMFHAEGIQSSDRMDETGTKTLLWATIPCAERDLETLGKLKEFLCR